MKTLENGPHQKKKKIFKKMYFLKKKTHKIDSHFVQLKHFGTKILLVSEMVYRRKFHYS